MRRSLRCALAALAFVAGPLAGPASAQPAREPVSLRLDWQLTGYHVPFYWAAEKGFFRDAGLEVTIKEGTGSGQTVNLVGSGQDDLGFADYLIMAAAAAKGMKAKAIFGVVQDGAWSVVSHADSPIRTPQDLVGRSVAVTADHKPLLDLFVKLKELPAEKVTVRVTNAATRNTVFDQGQVDGMFSITIGSPMDLVVRAKEGKSKPLHFMPFAEFGLAPQGQGVIANTAFLAAKPDLAKRFLAATARAFDEAKQAGNVDEAVAIAIRRSGASSDRTESVKLQWLDTIRHLGTPNTAGRPVGWMSDKDWAESLDVLRKTGRISGDVAADALYTNAFVPDAAK